MTPKERMYAAIEGRGPDVWPVAASYVMLSNADHWTELTGLPVWKYYEWLLSPDMGRYAEISRAMYDSLQFDAVQPMSGGQINNDGNVAIVERGGRHLYYDKKKNEYWPVPESIHESGSGGGENETRHIFTKRDAREKLKAVKAEQMISGGCNVYIEETIKLYGETRFVINSGVVNTFYSNAFHVGMTELYAMLREEPELIKYISGMVLEQNIETIRAYAAAGGDAIYIDDATATSDMISPQMYEEFSLPYIIPQVKEIQRLGKKAILIYFGGIADRAEQIASTGADVLMMECSMKGYTNDYEEISKKLNGRMCLAGNLNPYDDLEISSDEALSGKIREMVDKGRAYGRYFTCTGSPITPFTTAGRIKDFIALSHMHGANR